MQVPVWKKFKDAFEVPNAVAVKLAKGNNTILRPGLKITLAPPAQANDNNARPLLPPVLVDFVGGKHRMGNGSEDSAVDALVMGSDGRLFVINSREQSDSDNAGSSKSAASRRERQERLAPCPQAC